MHKSPQKEKYLKTPTQQWIALQFFCRQRSACYNCSFEVKLGWTLILLPCSLISEASSWNPATTQHKIIHPLECQVQICLTFFPN